VINSKKGILLYPRGGLGNQLFQYGAAYRLSKKLALPIYVNDVLLDRPISRKSDIANRNLELNRFENDIEFISMSSRPRKFLVSRLLTVLRLIGDRHPKLLLNLGFFSNEQVDQIQVFNLIN